MIIIITHSVWRRRAFTKEAISGGGGGLMPFGDIKRDYRGFVSSHLLAPSDTEREPMKGNWRRSRLMTANIV